MPHHKLRFATFIQGRVFHCKSAPFFYRDAGFPLQPLMQALRLHCLAKHYFLFLNMHFPLLLSAAFLWVFTFQTNNISEKASRPSSKPNSDTLYWRDGIQLSWDDFKAKSTDTKGYAAYTFTMITLNYDVKISGQTFTPTFTVKCAFQKSKSWVNRKDTNSQTPEILAHEQLHFTIAEITARKLRRNLKAQQYTKNYKKEINEIYTKTLDEGEKMQERYDKETNHSINKEAQKNWSYLIQSDLGYLMGYQSN
jgi:hypothetical protein